MQVSGAVRLAVVITALLVAGGCATPVGVERGDTQSVYRSLTRSALTVGRPSAPTEQVLQQRGLSEAFARDSERVLAELRSTDLARDRDRLFALAELSFLHAEKTREQPYYLAAAVYAYAFLLPAGGAQTAGDIDPRLRLAADLYNLGVAWGLANPERTEVILVPQVLPLPWGQLALDVEEKGFLWGGYQLSRFIPVAKYKVRGLRTRYRRPGVGAPLAAEVTPAEVGPEAELARKRIPPRIKVPVTAFVRIEHVQRGVAEGQVRGRIELYSADEADFVEVDGRRLPLELEWTATLAYGLEGAPIYGSEYRGFLAANIQPFPQGLIMLNPYRPGRVPVVLIHGTVSSPARWAEMVNELENDPLLRARIQLWLFIYNTSNPILLSASQLRHSLQDTLRDIDPDGRDPALRRMVLIGHSQGGLLTRLMITDSGTRFWDANTDVPFAQIKASEANRKLLEDTMFFTPLPFAKTVVFMATPHRGSYRVTGLVLEAARRLVTLPVTVVKGLADVVRDNPDAIGVRTLSRVPTAVDNMRPGHRFVRTLSASPFAPGVDVHSIVAVRGGGPLAGRSDGVVNYESAHLEGVASEKVVTSGHSVQDNPEAILEVRRILREHLNAK